MACLVASSVDAEEVGRHDRDIESKYGAVIFFFPLGMPQCFDDMYFMREVANEPGLEAYSYVVNDLRVLAEVGEKSFNDQVLKGAEITSKYYTKEDFEMMAEKMKSMPKMPIGLPESVGAKFNMGSGQGFLYFAPDDTLHRYPALGCQGAPYHKEFRNLLSQFKSGKRRISDDWDLGEKKDVPSRF